MAEKKSIVFKCTNCRKEGANMEPYEFSFENAKKIEVGADRYSIFCPRCNTFLGIYEGGVLHSHKV